MIQLLQSLPGFCIVALIKIFSHLFYRAEFKWLTPRPEKIWSEVKLIIFLNHTSLYEPLFSQCFPFSFIYRFIHHMVAPAASKTLNRPLVGTFWKLMVPHASSISRKRDETWAHFLQRLSPQAVIMIAPEGRMKRANGLDAEGKPMTVRGGVADILEQLTEGKMLICYSGGLHHVQIPGQHLPKLFKTIKMNFEVFEIDEYKKQFSAQGREFKLQVTQDLQHRLETKCPTV